MLSVKARKGQSLVEYGILIAVICGGLLIMQMFVKKGFQGHLFKSAESMGEQFSGNETTINEFGSMSGNAVITEEVATNALNIGAFTTVPGLEETLDKDSYSYAHRAGAQTTTTKQQKTGAAKDEAVRWIDYTNDTEVVNFDDPF